MDRSIQEPSQDLYDYILFNLRFKSKQSNDVRLVFKEHFSNIITEPFNIIYPSFDYNCYFCSSWTQCQKLKELFFTKNNSIKTNNCDFHLTNYVKDQYTNWGYYEINDKIFRTFPDKNIQTIEKILNNNYGLNIVVFQNIKTEKIHVLIKADSYQKYLLDCCFSNNPKNDKNYHKSTSDKFENNNNRLISHQNTKLINEPSIKINNYINKNIDIEIYNGNLLSENVDVIVNAANVQLQLGGGIAGAIREKCGNRVQNECDVYIKKRETDMNISEVMHTNSYNLCEKTKFIIHACGPRWNDYSDDKKIECFNDLKNTFFNIFIYCEIKLKGMIQSIAIPLISSGIFGVPKDLCNKALFAGLSEYLNESNDDIRTLKLVKFINLDRETNSLLVQFFENILNDGIEPKENENVQNKDIKCDRCHDKKVYDRLSKCGCSYCEDCLDILEKNGNNCVNSKCSNKRKKNDNEK